MNFKNSSIRTVTVQKSNPGIGMIRTIKLIVILAALVNSTTSQAIWKDVTSEEMIEQSIIILQGALIGTARLSLEDKSEILNLGIIQISEVLKGKNEKGVALIVIRSENKSVASTQLKFVIGQKGIWILDLYSTPENDLYVVNHPQKFIPSKEKEKIRKIKYLLQH